MKTMGIVRRIDDLGRIVIPKEIRNVLRINNGDSLDVMAYDNKVVLQKFSNVAEKKSLVIDYVDAFSSFLGVNVLVCDRDKIISCSSFLNEEYSGKEISDSLLRFIDCRDKVNSTKRVEIRFIDQKTETCCYSLVSIITNSDAVGCVVFFSNDRALSTLEDTMAQILAKLLAKHLEY